ncbi:hypothetical protein ACX3UO_09745 [Corynebacterium coyleae]
MTEVSSEEPKASPILEEVWAPWTPSPAGYSRRAIRNAPRQYAAAVVPRIANERVALSQETQTILDAATIETVRFDATEAHRVVPFTPLLLRSESVASSRIEKLTSSARKVLEAEVTGRGSANANLIVANTRQMAAAVENARADVQGIVEMHRILLGQSSPNIAGRLRDQQVWIGGSDHSSAGALFCSAAPPAPRDVDEGPRHVHATRRHAGAGAGGDCARAV